MRSVESRTSLRSISVAQIIRHLPQAWHLSYERERHLSLVTPEAFHLPLAMAGELSVEHWVVDA